MKLEIRKERQVGIVSFPSQLDAIVAREARQEIHSLLETGYHRLVFDLERLRFVDSAGLSAIVAPLRAVRSVGGDIILVKPRQEILSILELTRLDQVFKIYDEVDPAIDAVLSSS